MTIGIGRVIQSKSSKISKGDHVISNFFQFSEYSIVTAKFLRVIDQTVGVEISAYLITLGKSISNRLNKPLILAILTSLISKTNSNKLSICLSISHFLHLTRHMRRVIFLAISFSSLLPSHSLSLLSSFSLSSSVPDLPAASSIFLSLVFFSSQP